MTNRVKIAILQGELLESVWAEAVEHGIYRIDNIPFEVYSLSLGDLVAASEKDGLLVLDGVYDKSGSGTVRIRIEGGLSSTAGQELLQLLAAEQLQYETYGDTIMAVDIPPGFDGEKVLARCEMLRDAGVSWEQSDPNGAFPLPVASGSPAEKKLLQQRETAEEMLQRLIDEHRKTPSS